MKRLRLSDGNSSVKEKRLQYIVELTDSINDSNDVLTQWIQLRQGELSLHIESFPLQSVFAIVAHGTMGFSLRGLKLVVKPTDIVVKADRTLTLFMVNTIADNARKFTPEGGTVTVEAVKTDQYAEISVTDTGKGMGRRHSGSCLRPDLHRRARLRAEELQGHHREIQEDERPLQCMHH